MKGSELIYSTKSTYNTSLHLHLQWEHLLTRDLFFLSWYRHMISAMACKIILVTLDWRHKEEVRHIVAIMKRCQKQLSFRKLKKPASFPLISSAFSSLNQLKDPICGNTQSSAFILSKVIHINIIFPWINHSSLANMGVTDPSPPHPHQYSSRYEH